MLSQNGIFGAQILVSFSHNTLALVQPWDPCNLEYVFLFPLSIVTCPLLQYSIALSWSKCQNRLCAFLFKNPVYCVVLWSYPRLWSVSVSSLNIVLQPGLFWNGIHFDQKEVGFCLKNKHSCWKPLRTMCVEGTALRECEVMGTSIFFQLILGLKHIWNCYFYCSCSM